MWSGMSDERFWRFRFVPLIVAEVFPYGSYKYGTEY